MLIPFTSDYSSTVDYPINTSEKPGNIKIGYNSLNSNSNYGKRNNSAITFGAIKWQKLFPRIRKEYWVRRVIVPCLLNTFDEGPVMRMNDIMTNIQE